MLRKLASPKRESRFAAAMSSAAGGKATPQEMSSLAADAPSPTQPQQPPSDTKVPAGDSQGKKKKKSAEQPSTNVEATAAQPQQPQTLSLDLQAVSKAEGSSDDHEVENEEAHDTPRVTSPSPLLRTPRKKAIFDEDDAKATSPTAKSPKKSKRDSLGLKGLTAKREKAKEETKKIKEERKDSPKKSKKTPDNEDEAQDDAGAPALSPIRRKPRPATDSTDKKIATATIRDATSLLSRTKRLDSTRSDAISPLQQPELHIIGEIVGGDGFGKATDGYCCKWSVDYGNQWVHIAGDQLGQTQIDYTDNSPPDDSCITWSHPLDLHFTTTVFHGWPKILLQVWRVDSHMKMNVVGYGFVHVPFTPGHHRLTVSMWRPMGSSKEELEAALLGHTLELLTDEVLFNTAWAERCRLKTIATGRVHVDFGVILRNFHTTGSKMDM